jgi:hypothetical protein
MRLATTPTQRILTENLKKSAVIEMKAEPEFADGFGPWKVLEELSDPLVSGECERLQTGEIPVWTEMGRRG